MSVGKPQQEAQGAVAWSDSFAADARRYAAHFRVMARSNPGTMIEGVVSLLDDISLITTPPAPVDVRVPMSRIIELLAQLVNAPQTNDEFDADVIRRDVVMEKVTQLRMAWDELSKAQRALLDGQPAGVVIDDAMVRRAVHAYDEWMIEHAPDETDAYHDGMRAALQAALGGGGRGS